MILAEHCQADATIAFCQQQQDLSAAAMCAAPTESEQTDGEKWRKTPPVLDGDFGGQVQLRGRAAVPCRLAAEGHGGGDGGELAGGAVGGAATGEGGSHEVWSGYVESGRALQCASQGAQMGAGAALQPCAVQGTVNAPQGATPMTIDDAAAKMDGPPDVTETNDDEGRELSGARRGAQRKVGPALKSRAGPGAVGALKCATPVLGGYDGRQEGGGGVEGEGGSSGQSTEAAAAVVSWRKTRSSTAAVHGSFRTCACGEEMAPMTKSDLRRHEMMCVPVGGGSTERGR